MSGSKPAFYSVTAFGGGVIEERFNHDVDANKTRGGLGKPLPVLVAFCFI